MRNAERQKGPASVSDTSVSNIPHSPLPSARLHIFWQCRVHQGDDYPWWYPSQTTGGSIREDRLVLPMDPNQHWTQARPVLLPGMRDRKQIEADAKAAKALKPKRVTKAKTRAAPAIDPNHISSGGFRFAPIESKGSGVAGRAGYEDQAVAAATPDPVRTKKPAEKNDPALVRKVRSLRDAYLHEVNAGYVGLPMAGKYDVTKALPAAAGMVVRRIETRTLPALPAAA
jgi:hypothetical protein